MQRPPLDHTRLLSIPDENQKLEGALALVRNMQYAQPFKLTRNRSDFLKEVVQKGTVAPKRPADKPAASDEEAYAFE